MGSETQHFCILGANYHTGNRGCRALTASMIGLISDFQPGSRISLLYPHPNPETLTIDLSQSRSIEINLENCRLGPRPPLRRNLFLIMLTAGLWRFTPIQALKKLLLKTSPWLSEMERASIVGEIAGGDSFSDVYGFKHLFTTMLPLLSAFILKKPVVFLPQTLGPYRKLPSKMLARFFIKRAACVLIRDHASWDVVHSLFHKQQQHNKVFFCPDVAFSLQPIQPKRIRIEPSIEKDRQRPLVGVNPSGLLYNEKCSVNNPFKMRFDYRELLLQVLAILTQEHHCSVLLIPHTYGADQSDDDAVASLAQTARSRNIANVHILNGVYSEHELKHIIGQCQFFVGSRMHACIAALSQCVPAAAIAYSGKFVGLFSTINMEELVIDARNCSATETVGKITSMFCQRHILRKKLEQVIPGTIIALRERFQSALSPFLPLQTPGQRP